MPFKADWQVPRILHNEFNLESGLIYRVLAWDEALVFTKVHEKVQEEYKTLLLHASLNFSLRPVFRILARDEHFWNVGEWGVLVTKESN
jgi:hypothetical protein